MRREWNVESSVELHRASPLSALTGWNFITSVSTGAARRDLKKRVAT